MATLEKSRSIPQASELSAASISKASTEGSTNGPPAAGHSSEPEYPSAKVVVPIMGGLMLGMFLMALDRTIIATAIPAITDEFNSLGDIGWYGSSYMLTMCAFQLLFAKIYMLYSPKIVYLSSLVLFEVGSAVCGAAPNSIALIVGRAIAGIGAAGMMSGAIKIFMHIVPIRKQPLVQGLMGGVFAIAMILGPLIGGAFTDSHQLTWRWCFYINLPLGAVTIIVVLFLLKLDFQQRGPKLTAVEQFWKLDPIGTAVFVPGIICLLIALQWGGARYSWSSGRIIALLVVGVLLIVAFVGVQIWQKDNASIPPRILTHRTVYCSLIFSFCIGAMLVIILYELPLYFQVVKGASAQKSGIMNLALIISHVVASLISGFLIYRIGYYNPFMIATAVMSAIAAGLMTTFTPSSGHAEWIGYQVLFGLGLGLGMTQSGTAVRNTLEKEDAAIGVSAGFFMQTFSGAIFLAASQTVLQNVLVGQLAHVDGLTPEIIINTGATDLRSVVAPFLVDTVIAAYDIALTKVFYIPVALACVAFVASLGIEWKTIKSPKKEPEKGEA